MKVTLIRLLSLAYLVGAPAADAAVVSLSTADPVVMQDTPVQIDLSIEYGAGEPTTLFSFGARLDVTGPGTATLVSIDAAPLLNYFGTAGAGAYIDPAQLVLGVKGTVNVLEPPVVAYSGSLLAQYSFEFPQQGEYTITPRAFNTLGPTEEIFVAGDGTVLDPQIDFRSLTVFVVPEPTPGLLVLLAGTLLCLRRRRDGG